MLYNNDPVGVRSKLQSPGTPAQGRKTIKSCFVPSSSSVTSHYTDWKLNTYQSPALIQMKPLWNQSPKRRSALAYQIFPCTCRSLQASEPTVSHREVAATCFAARCHTMPRSWTSFQCQANPPGSNLCNSWALVGHGYCPNTAVIQVSVGGLPVMDVAGWDASIGMSMWTASHFGDIWCRSILVCNCWQLTHPHIKIWSYSIAPKNGGGLSPQQ